MWVIRLIMLFMRVRLRWREKAWVFVVDTCITILRSHDGLIANGHHFLQYNSFY